MSGKLIDGGWVRQTDWDTDAEGAFQRAATTFRARVEPGADGPHPPERGRFHLYVSYACPWAHRTLLMRLFKGLEGAVSVTVAHPLMGEDGWAFRHDDGTPAPDPVCGARFLRDVYTRADPGFTGRVTVPVLWDCARKTIVNNDSREIMRMLDTAFDAFAEHRVSLYPVSLARRIEETIDALYEPVNNGVYRCGFASTQRAYQRAFDQLFDALDHWEGVLAQQRYLCGEVLTEADICLFTTLLRFDPVYYVHFKCNERRILDYPQLSAYLREFYQMHGVASLCRFDHIKRHYYGSHPGLNPKGIVPAGPDLSWLARPHDRERLTGRPLESLTRRAA
jgi:glutathionyl-hydroquinone reductase